MPALDPYRKFDLNALRLLCLVGGLTLPLLGLLHVALGAEVADPEWLRLSAAALPLCLLAGSYVSPAVRREMDGLALMVLSVVVIVASIIAHWNAFAAEYILAVMLCVIGLAGVASIALRRQAYVGITLGTAALAPTLLALFASTTHVPALEIGAMMVALVLVLWVLMGRHMRIQIRARAGERRYRSAFESCRDAMVLVRASDHAVLSVNGAYLSITGFSRQEALAMNLADMLGGRLDEVERGVKLSLEGKVVHLGETQLVRRDKGVVDIEITISPIPEQAESVVCVAMRDLTAEKQTKSHIAIAQEQAKSMYELRSIFLHNMNHELRTPLVSLTGFLDLLENEADDISEQERRDMLASLRRSADRLNRTLNALLDLAQIENGEVRLHPEPVEINQATEMAARSLQPLARDKGLRIRFVRCEETYAVVDAKALNRILLNVFTNAIKFTSQGTVTIAVEADSHRVFVHVRDTGSGIDPEFLPHLFSAFRQESAGMAREHEGAGIGLTITKRLLDLMGGRIRVDSTPGQGTQLTVIFARTFEKAPQHPVAVAPMEEHNVGGDGAVGIAPIAARPRALVVEDNFDTARLISRLLQGTLDVEIAHDAHHALNNAKRAWYDFLLIDINLGPGMDGIRLLHQLRRMSAYAHVPAVAVTTYTAPGDRGRFLAAGFDAYLAKPFTREELVRAVERAHAARALAAT